MVLKQALNHGLILKKAYRVIQFNQKAWLKPYIDMNTKLRIEAKNDFEKDFFKLMNNSVFGKKKTMEKAKKYYLVTTDKRRNQLLQDLITIWQNTFQKNLIAIEITKI